MHEAVYDFVTGTCYHFQIGMLLPFPNQVRNENEFYVASASVILSIG